MASPPRAGIATVNHMRRRTFLKALPAGAAAVSAASAEEVPVPVKLGFDTYSLRAFQWKGVKLLEYAANLKLDTIQFSSLDDYGGLDAVSYTHLTLPTNREV